MKRPPKFGKGRVRTRRILRSWWFRSLVVLALLGGCVWAGQWALGKFERRQSRQLVEMASGYLQEGKVEEARMGLDTAVRLDPRNAQALRMLARLREAQGSGQEAMEAMRRLSESGQLTLDDLSTYSMMAARNGDSALAERLADAAARGGNPVLRHLLRAELAAGKNDLEGAEKELREAAEADKAGGAKLALARFLVQRRLNAETAPEVLKMLQELSANQGPLGAEALALGVAGGVVPRDGMGAWITSMRAHPAKNGRMLLLADTAEVALAPDGKTAVAGRMAARLQGAAVEERVQGMVWAMRMGEPAVASGMLSPEEAAKDAGVFSAWLDALAVQGKWQEISAQLAREGQPLPVYLRTLYAGRALVEQGKVAEGRAEYAKALQVSYANREDFIRTVAYLATAGDEGLFEQGLRRALEDKPDRRDEVMRAVVPAVASKRDAAETLRVYEIAASVPGAAEEGTLQNDMDYLALVLDRPVDGRRIALRSGANPRDFSYRLTHAMALIREGKGKEALQVLEDCEPDVFVPALPPHQKAVVAAALASAGKPQEAVHVASMVPPAGISRQEADFLVERIRAANPPTTAPAPAAAKKPEAKKK